METPLLDGIIKSSAFIPWDKLGRPGVLPIAGGLLGAGSGALLNPDDRLGGAAIGAGSGALLGLLGHRAMGHTLRGNYLMQDAKENAARIKDFLKKQYV